MAKRMPSMVALLGLLAVAGYQNRAKLGELLQGAGGNPDGSGRTPARPGGDLLSDLRASFGGAGAGGTLAEGLSSLVDRFRNAGRGDLADSWVSTGTNQPVEPDGLEAALGAETLTELESKTGLSRAEILRRLSDTLPAAVDGMTPEGRVPSSSDAEKFI